MRAIQTIKRPFLAGSITGLITLFIPLLRDLHWESALLSALVVCFYSGIRSAGGASTFVIIRDALAVLIGWIIPLAFFSLITGCFSFHGLAFWIFVPVPSLLFGLATGRLIHKFNFPKPELSVVLVLISAALIPVLFEFLRFPQLYFFNHIWGYIPGPIYDEIVLFDTRLIAFRTITLLWVIVLWMIPGMYESRQNMAIVLLALFSLFFFYSRSSDWGLIAPEQRLQQELGAASVSDHFRIFYDPAAISSDSAKVWTDIHERYLSEITEVLEVGLSVYKTTPIHSYLYRDADQKKKLTGAGVTSYVPVWLKQDQMHMALDHAAGVLKHELVHVVAKQFGNYFGASKIGLVEGLAVAVATERFRGATIDQMVAARDHYPTTEELEKLFSFAGFYSQPGVISYTITGSFIKYLIENYPVSKLKTAYETGNLVRAYEPVTMTELTDKWHTHLSSVPVDSAIIARSNVLFSRPSIFQKPCPRVEIKHEFAHFFNADSSHSALYACL